MQAFHLPRGFALQGLLIAIAVVVATLLLVAWLGIHDAAIEGGPLERGQEAALVAAALFFAVSAAYQRGAGRMAAVGASVLAVVFFLRELELTGNGPIAMLFNAPHFRLYETVVICAVALPYIALRWRLIGEHIAYLKELRGWPFVCVAVLLLIGEAFDGHPTLAGIDYLPMLIEETVEIFAYILFASIGLHVLRNAIALHRHTEMGSESQHKAL